ncbi:hypothetical protein ACWEIJ_05030 [Lentzea sp. NPDC004789]
MIQLISIIASTALAFLVLESMDKEPVTGESALVWIQQTSGSTSSQSAGRMIESFARDHRVSVVRQVPDLRNPDGLLHLYIAAGNPGSAPASWLAGGFPSFGRAVRVDTHRMADLEDPDPRGVYRVFGDAAEARALKARFEELGLDGKIVPPWGLEKWVLFHALTERGSVFLVMLVAVAVAVGTSVLSGVRGYGVMRLHGLSFPAILRRDLLRLGSSWLAACLGVGAVSLVVLGLYNGFARLGLFAAVAGALAGALLLLAVVSHTVALALAHSRGIVGALKGELAPWPALAAMYAVRTAAALVVLLVGASAVTSLEDVTNRAVSQRYFSALGSESYITVAGSRTEEAGEQMAQQVGTWLRQADGRGELILSARFPARLFANRNQDFSRIDVLVVNDTFLAAQPVLDPAGQAYGPGHGGRVRLIVPEGLRGLAGTFAGNLAVTISPGDRGQRVREAGVDTVWARDGQEIFTFHTAGVSGAEDVGKDRSLLRDPVVIVLPNGSGLFGYSNYTASATQNAIVFKDPRDVLRARGTEVPAEHVPQVYPAARSAAGEQAQATRQLWISVAGLAAALAALFVSGVGVCLIYTRRNAQRVFAQHLHGRSFAAIHGRLFALDALVALAPLGWLGWNAWTRAAEREHWLAAGAPPSSQLPPVTIAEFAPAVNVTLVAVALLLLSLAFAHRRIVRSNAAVA